MIINEYGKKACWLDRLPGIGGTSPVATTLIPPCHLHCFGDEEDWGFAFYTYTDSNGCSELSVFPSGEFLGPPEEAFRALVMYLQ
jgi:hypothetical protein